MGYFFTVLYILTAYLSPPVLFGPLTEYHIEVVIVILALITSLPNFFDSGLLRAPQTIALAGMAFAIFASIAQSGWFGGGLEPVYGFLQPTFAFLLVAVNCKRKWHFSMMTLALVAASSYFIYMGLHDLHANLVPSEFLYGDGTLRRLRGLGFVHDPNDLSQVLVSLLPCLFFFRKKIILIDFWIIGLPIALLLVGMYYTHSRGALLATTAIVLFSARRKIGTIPACILAGVLVVGLFSLGWSGGRDISMEGGADRLDLWYDGLEAFKAHPLFGIGLNHFAEEFGITAHNSAIICAAELGFVGLFFWIMMIVSSVRLAARLQKNSPARSTLEFGPSDEPDDLFARPATSIVANPSGDHADNSRIESPIFSNGSFQSVEHATSPQNDDATHETEGAEPENERDSVAIANLLLIAVIGTLTAGWFLSRTFSMWLFMYFGMIYAASRMNRTSVKGSRESLTLILKWSAWVTVVTILALYVIIRSRNVLGH